MVQNSYGVSRHSAHESQLPRATVHRDDANLNYGALGSTALMLSQTSSGLASAFTLFTTPVELPRQSDIQMGNHEMACNWV